MTNAFRLSRRVLLTGLPGFALAGCTDIIGPPPAPNLYRFEPPMPVAVAGPKVGWALAVEAPSASAALDTDRIAITRPPATLDYYADAAWTDHVPALVLNALIQAFRASGRIQAVARDSQAAHADYILSGELRDFEARYDLPNGPPRAVVGLNASLIAADSRKILGNVEAVRSALAAANTVDSAVQAFDEAMGEVLAVIVPWALGVPPVQ